MIESSEIPFQNYLVLGIGVQVDDTASSQAVIHLYDIDSASPAYYSLRKSSDVHEPRGFLARAFWMINIPGGAPLREAYHYAHGIESLAPIVPFCTAQSVDDLINVMPFPEPMASDSTFRVSTESLIEIFGDKMIELFGGEDMFELVYGTCKIESVERAQAIATYLQRYAGSEDFARACSYLHLSMMELGIDACDWGQEDFDQSFYRYVSVSRAESAFLNAFKVLESIVGEPSKNRTEAKIRARLEHQEINPDELVGYRQKMTVLKRILMYHPLRDQIAAHGIGKIKRDLQLAEIIELQALARFMLLQSFPKK